MQIRVRMLKMLLTGTMSMIVLSSAGLAKEKRKETLESYRATIEARAKQAESQNNVAGMLQSAYALYPLEAAEGAKKPRFKALLDGAAKAALASKDKNTAQQFLELVGPLGTELSEQTRDKLTTQALGMAPEKAIAKDAEDLTSSLKKIAPDLVNPDIKSRGIGRDTAELFGKTVLTIVRPSSLKHERHLLSFAVSARSSNRINVTCRMRWYGYFSENPYTSTITCKLFISGRSIEILGVDYLDDCLFPAPDTRLVTVAVNKLNELLQ